MTVLDLINGALRLLGVIESGENASAAEAQDALAALNDLLDTWSTERLLVYGVQPQVFALVAGQKVYTLGAGGNWDIPRPVQVDSMYLQYTDSATQPLNLPIPLLNQQQYNGLMVPNTTSSIVTAAYVDDAFPLRNVFVWPVPSSGYSVNLFVWTLIPAFGAITDAVSLPPGYARMLRFNLALELSAEYGIAPSPTVAAGALDAKAAVKLSNIRPLYLACDPAVASNGGGWNYLTGE